MTLRTVVSNPTSHLFWFPVIWVEVIFHKGFGELYLWKDNKKAIIWGFVIPFGVFAEPSLTDFSPYAHYFFGLFVLRCLFENARLAIAKLKNKAPHSYCMGGSFSIWRLIMPNLEIVSRFVEPLICVLVGIVLFASGADVLLGALLIWCGIGIHHKFNVLDEWKARLAKEKVDREGEV